MKRLFALLCAVVLLSLVSVAPAEYEFSWDYDDKIPMFHELWDVPWGATPEEFLEKARDGYSIPFIDCYKNDISIPTRYYSIDAYTVTSPDDPVYLFNYPVQISATFEYSPVTEGRDEEGSFWAAEPGGKFGLTCVKFVFLNLPDSAISAWFMANDVFYKLYSHYGEPWAVHTVPWNYFSGLPEYTFAVPITDMKIDVRKLIEKGLDDTIWAHFDNIIFEFDLSQNPEDYKTLSGRGRMCLTVFPPKWRHWESFDIPISPHPFETFDKDGSPYWPPNPTPDPALTAPQIDVGLW